MSLVLMGHQLTAHLIACVGDIEPDLPMEGEGQSL